MTTAYLPGSAWETWTNAGAQWRAANQNANFEAAREAAALYADERGFPGNRATIRAFMEGWLRQLSDEREAS